MVPVTGPCQSPNASACSPFPMNDSDVGDSGVIELTVNEYVETTVVPGSSVNRTPTEPSDSVLPLAPGPQTPEPRSAYSKFVYLMFPFTGFVSNTSNVIACFGFAITTEPVAFCAVTACAAVLAISPKAATIMNTTVSRFMVRTPSYRMDLRITLDFPRCALLRFTT